MFLIITCMLMCNTGTQGSINIIFISFYVFNIPRCVLSQYLFFSLDITKICRGCNTNYFITLDRDK